MIARIAAAISAVLLSAVIAFQLALVVGAPWGEYTQGGTTTGALPMAGRVMAAISIVVLGVFALALLARVGWGPLRRAPQRLVTVVVWVSVGYAAIAVLLNTATPSAKERLVWAPVSVILLVAQLTAVLGSRRPKAK
jgi:ABC-type phosphate transport system permease subunit